jgi:CRP-like cAMP-binding protein
MESSRSLAVNHVFGTMAKADYARLEPLMVRTTLDRDFVLNEIGSNVDAVYFPAGAVLSIVTVMEGGQGVETCTIGHENAYGLDSTLGATRAVELAICQIPGVCYHIPTSQLKIAASESPALTDLFIRHIQANLAQTSQSVACNAIHPVEARLCRWLLMSHDRAGADVLPLTQEFLGFMLGVQRTTVTIAARALQAAGLIKYKRGHIEIIDRDGLEDGACECYEANAAKRALFFEGFPRLR